MTDPIQQQLIAARKHQILDAAAVVFAEKGFHPTTIRDIAKQAGIADGTIYNYFSSKPALLLGIFERMKAAILQENLPLLPEAGDLRGFIRLFVAQPLLALKRDNFALFRIVISECMVNEEMRRLYYGQILEPTLALAEVFLGDYAAERGISSVQLKLSLRAISGMMLGVMLEYVMGDELVMAHWDQLPDTLTALVLDGLG